MPLILGTNSIKDTGYDVANSCRFDDGSSDYLARTNGGSPTSSSIFTFSCWIKKSQGVPSEHQVLFGNFDSTDNTGYFRFNDDATLRYFDKQGGSSRLNYTTTAVFRDVSAWYNLIINVDTSRSSGDRVRIFSNGTQLTTSAATDTSGNLGLLTATSSNGMTVGAVKRPPSPNYEYYYDGYMTEVVFIDGQALDPTSFGEFDSDSPTIWKPIDVSGLTFGTNGFHLDFENASSLGADVSGNSNNFTVNNLTSIDQSTDTCTNNFATLNPLYHYIGGSTLSEGNLKFTTSGNSSVGRGMSTIRPESGKWYVECKIIDVTRFAFGLMNGNETNSSQGGENTNSVIFGYDGGFYMAGGFTGYLSAPSNNDIVQLALDLDNDLFWIGVNDTWGNSATRTQIENSTASNDATTFISSKVPINTGAIGIFVETNSSTGNNVCEMNFGNPTFSISSGNSDANGFGNFEYAPPSGYFFLCTKNLAEFG